MQITDYISPVLTQPSFIFIYLRNLPDLFPCQRYPCSVVHFPPDDRHVPYLSNSASHPSVASQNLFVFLVPLRATVCPACSYLKLCYSFHLLHDSLFYFSCHDLHCSFSPCSTGTAFPLCFPHKIFLFLTICNILPVLFCLFLLLKRQNLQPTRILKLSLADQQS